MVREQEAHWHLWGGYDVFLAKYDANGNYQWAKSMGGSGADGAYGLAVDAGRNVYITGWTSSGSINFNPEGTGGSLTPSGTFAMFIAKYDAEGNYLWAKTGGRYGTGIAVDHLGNSYVTGYFNSTTNFDPEGTEGSIITNGGYDAYLAKYAENGNFQWVKNIGGTSREDGYAVAVDSTGSVYVTGRFSSSNADFDPGPDSVTLVTSGGYDIFVAKYSSDGNYIWAKGMGGTGTDAGNGIKVTADGSIYVTGVFNSDTADFNPGGTGGIINAGGVNNIFLLKLNQLCQSFTTLTETACNSYIFNGTTYTTSGIYNDTFSTELNCDSIVTLNLTINYSSPVTTLTPTACDSFSLLGKTYTSSGQYSDTLSNISGCDSVIVLDLTITHTSDTVLSLNACDSLVLNDSIYTVSGTYTQVLPNTAGCDSIITLHLEINSSPQATVTQTGDTLKANDAETYQWLECGNGQGTPIPGALEQNYVVTEPGYYSVVTTIGDCSDTSACIWVEQQSGINKLDINTHVIQLYPNPANSLLTLATEHSIKNATIRLFNSVGQLLSEQTGLHGSKFTLDISNYSDGLLFIEIREDRKLTRMKIVKESL